MDEEQKPPEETIEETVVDVNDELGKIEPEDVKKTPSEIEAVVLNVSMRLAGEIFGSKAEDQQKQMVVVEFENAEHDVKEHDVFAYYPKEELNDMSKMGRFLVKYGKLQAGTKVMLKRSDQGFWKLNLAFVAP